MSTTTTRASFLGLADMPRWQRLAFIGTAATALAVLVSFTLVVQQATQRAAGAGLAGAVAAAPAAR